MNEWPKFDPKVVRKVVRLAKVSGRPMRKIDLACALWEQDRKIEEEEVAKRIRESKR